MFRYETAPLDDQRLPPLPMPDKQGQFPALEYTCVSLARDLIRDRRSAGWTQQQLAEKAGTRQETIARIEGGNYTAPPKLIERIDRVLQAAPKKARNARPSRRR